MNAIYAQARFRLRAVSSEKLDCGWRVCIANSVVSAADVTSPKAQQSSSKLDIQPIYTEFRVCKNSKFSNSFLLQ